MKKGNPFGGCPFFMGIFWWVVCLLHLGLAEQIKCPLYNKRQCMTDYPARSPELHIPQNTDKRQDNSSWLQVWQQGQTEGFHQTLVNPLLTRFWRSQNLRRHSRVLVPLCGKSLDMMWLAAQGHKVVGVELSPIAVKDFFEENSLKVKKTRQGNFMRWQSGSIVIWCGDFFSLRKRQLGCIDNVFDRASLTALPEEVRAIYVDQLRKLIGPNADVFLLTVEEIVKQSGQAVMAIDQEIMSLYAEHFEITLTHSQRSDDDFVSVNGDDCYTDDKVYQLNPLI